MRGLISKILGDVNKRELKKLYPIVGKINALEDQIKALSDAELRLKTVEFRERLDRDLSEVRSQVAELKSRVGANADKFDRQELEAAQKRHFVAEQDLLWELLPEAFAVVREASQRVLGMRHFDVQLLGGIVLHQGRVAEMKTGEGKTLVATLPAYLNALAGRGVHVITVNDYLASRDRKWMGEVYEFLGLRVGLIVHGLASEERRESYAADITYGTNNEFGFDYLRDNMVLYKENLAQRPLNYAIVDEVDSILIDEARTPLIISGQMKDEKQEDDYMRINQAVRRLKKEDHFTVDEKASSIVLTEEGEAQVEMLLGEKGLYGEEDIIYEEVETQQAQMNKESDRRNIIKKKVENALRANNLMKRDKDYVVNDGQIVIVDEFTGRLMHGRRYSEGLHQSIEAKEGVKVAKESMTLASVTFQNYFRMYNKLAGMTGTAQTEEQEFQSIYGMDVMVVDTNKPMIRHDLPDVIYKSEQGKFRAVVEEIVERHKTGQPILVGTISIELSEELSRLLQKRGVAHEVLNAKHHDKEAKIIAQAGRLNSVTIATNMAGRGTDIVLGGNPESLAEDEFRATYGMTLDALRKMPETDEQKLHEAKIEFERLEEKYLQQTRAERENVVSAGGLHILGTERHESRRIDNQLRGRAGRQGDPGSSQFFISLEDDLMRLFGGDNIVGIMEKVGLDEDTPIDHSLITRAIETAQKKVEARNFDIRKHILEYDDVINEQREVIYGQRRRVLEGENLRDTVMEWIPDLVDDAIGHYASESMYDDEWQLQELVGWAEGVFLPAKKLGPQELQGKSREELREMLLDEANAFYGERERRMGEETMRELERVVILRTVDAKWMSHIDAMDELRHGVGLRAYGQRDPLVEYKREAYEMFHEMIHLIKEESIRLLYRAQVMAPPQRQAVAVANETPPSDGTAVHGPARSEKVGRNEPCPCGSGKKHKKCCGK
jgi:preprotein translocase subunit SecA